MAWIVLIISGLFEAVWATALGRITGPQSYGAIAAFVGGSMVSMWGLWWALKTLPTGTGYSIWVAVGAATTVLYAVSTGEEPFSLAKALLLVGLVGCVIGLKLVDG
ncbi:DMT family transporter [Kytococcus sp. Marseille-QA3725]